MFALTDSIILIDPESIPLTAWFELDVIAILQQCWADCEYISHYAKNYNATWHFGS